MLLTSTASLHSRSFTRHNFSCKVIQVIQIKFTIIPGKLCLMFLFNTGNMLKGHEEVLEKYLLILVPFTPEGLSCALCAAKRAGLDKLNFFFFSSCLPLGQWISCIRRYLLRDSVLSKKRLSAALGVILYSQGWLQSRKVKCCIYFSVIYFVFACS